jgi:hypothetical protein
MRMARLSSVVATGRRMKGAEICIVACQAKIVVASPTQADILAPHSTIECGWCSKPILTAEK